MATASEPTPEPPPTPASTPAFRAAQYVRMSTEHQQYSTQNQADKIQEYADRRNHQSRPQRRPPPGREPS